MATLKPQSTISYNTERFLKEKLDSWINSHLIQSYMYICHKGEDGDKDHIHLRIEPNKKLDVMDLTENLQEYDKLHPDKPLCVRPWRPSVEEDFLLYVVHDKDYLKMKYGNDPDKEKLPYDWTDIVANSTFDIETAFIRAKSSMKHTAPSVVKRIENGDNLVNMIKEGENPYMLNTLAHLVYNNKYEKVVRENALLQTQIDQLQRQINKLGYEIVCDKNGNLLLEKQHIDFNLSDIT